MPSSDPALEAIQNLNVKPDTPPREVPGDLGFPVIGHSLKILRNAPRFVQSQYKKYGPVFKMSAFGTSSVNFASVEAAKMILMNKDKNFSSELGWFRVKPLLLRGILLRDFSNHRGHRRVLQQAFKRPLLEHYAEKLNTQLAQGVKAWPVGTSFKFQDHAKSLLLDNAASLFMGAKLGPESDELNKHFVALLHATVSFLHLPIPGTSWHAGVKGGEFLRKWLRKQVSSRINSGQPDFFTSLCDLSNDEDNDMDIDEVIEHTVLLLFAAHDTTTSTISSIVSVLCEKPEWQEKLRIEALSLNKGSVSIKDFEKMPLTDQFFNEVLRLYPPIFVILRRCINSFEYNGIHIPANTQTNVNISLLHHNAEYWTNPHEFDPERFSPERAEHKKDLFQYLPFGGGAHKCLGINFAEIQTKILLFHLLRNYQIETKAGRDTRINFLPMPLPKDGLPVTLTPI